MLALAREIKTKLEKFESYSLKMTVDDFMENLSEIAERKDYGSKMGFFKAEELKKDRFKVWEIKNTSLLGDIIDQEAYRHNRRTRDYFFYTLKNFSRFVRLVENVFYRILVYS